MGWEVSLRALDSQDVLVSSHGGDDDAQVRSNVCRPIVHRNAKSPIVGALQFFVSETWIRRIRYQSFQLLPELKPHFLRKIVQPFQHRSGDDYVSRQSALGLPLPT